MPRRKPKRLCVRLEEHAHMRWRERTGRPVGKLEGLLTVLLTEQLGVGLQVRHGRAVMYLDKDRLDIPCNLEAHLDPPNLHNVWRVITFKPSKCKGA